MGVVVPVDVNGVVCDVVTLVVADVVALVIADDVALATLHWWSLT